MVFSFFVVIVKGILCLQTTVLVYNRNKNDEKECENLMEEEKVLIVEGKSDRKRVESLLDEPVKIICTYGTLSEEKLENLILPIEDFDVYILVDQDESGEKLRKQLKRELPNATHLYTEKEYGQVETTPLDFLASVLRKNFIIKDVPFSSN